MPIAFDKLRIYFASFLVVALLFLAGGTDSYGWIYVDDEESQQPPIIMIDTINKNCPLDIYVDHKQYANITTSYIMELKPERVYHIEIKCGKDKKTLFETSMSLSMGKEVILQCRDESGCTIGL